MQVLLYMHIFMSIYVRMYIYIQPKYHRSTETRNLLSIHGGIAGLSTVKGTV